MSIFSNPLVSGGMIIGGLTTIFYSCKSLIFKLFAKLRSRFIFNVTVYDYDELFYVLERWLNVNYSPKLRSLEASYNFNKSSIDNPYVASSALLKSKQVSYKSEPTVFVIKATGKRIIISKNKKEITAAQESLKSTSFSYSLSSWKGKLAITNFLNLITEEHNKTLVSDKLTIYSPGYDSWNTVCEKKVKDITSVILNKDIKKFIKDDLDKFAKSRDWYNNLCVGYKRGYLLHGPGGTGKTTLAQAMAAYLHKDLCILNLSSVAGDQYLITLFAKIPENTLLILEDIDCVFEGRKAVDRTAITFSCLLNCLDGVVAKEGLVTVITTNHIEKLDPALIRTGRTDVHIEMPLACKEEISEYMTLFYNRNIQIKKDMCVGMSSVQESCIRNSSCPEAAIKEIYNLVAKPNPILN